MPELRGLLLDFDGTIAETERFGHRVAYNCAFAEMGLGWTWDESLYGELLRVAGGKERVRSFIERHHPHPVSYTHLRAHETDSYLVCRLLLEKKKNNRL